MTVEHCLVEQIHSAFERSGRLPDEIRLGFWPWRTLLDEIWDKMCVGERCLAVADRLMLDGVLVRHVVGMDPDAIMVIL